MPIYSISSLACDLCDSLFISSTNLNTAISEIILSSHSLLSYNIERCILSGKTSLFLLNIQSIHLSFNRIGIHDISFKYKVSLSTFLVLERVPYRT